MFRIFLAQWLTAMLLSAGCLGADGSPEPASDAPARTCFDGAKSPNHIQLRDLPALPGNPRGAFLGQVGGAILVAGGAEEIPAGGELSGAKFRDTIYVLHPPEKKKKDDRSFWEKALDWLKPIIGLARARKVEPEETYREWELAEVRLPAPVAFGAAAVHDNALICLGGYTANGASAQVFRIKYEPEKKGKIPEKWKVVVESPTPNLPDLPQPLAFHAARVLDEPKQIVGPKKVLYVLGGLTGIGRERQNRTIYMLGLIGAGITPSKSSDAEKDSPEVPIWKPMVPLTLDGKPADPVGEGLILPMLEVRFDENAYLNSLLVFGGRRCGEGQADRYVPSAACWKYVPGKGACSGWTRLGDFPKDLEPDSSVPLGPSHAIVAARREPKPEQTLNELAARGGGERLLLYHTLTNTWVKLRGDPGPAEGRLCPLGSGFAWIGSARDAQNQVIPAARRGRLEYEEKAFGVVNSLVVYGFFGLMVLIGFLCRKKGASTEQYLLGGRKIPWWASGLSMWATGVSAISLMAIPAKTYATDWSYMWLGIFPPIILSLSAVLFIPLLRRLTIMSITEYFELRFHPSLRVMSTCLLILNHTFVKMSVTLLVPAFALSAVAGWDVHYCIIIMAVVATLFTVVGGLEGVIWTDVAQSVIMVVGPVLAFVLIIGGVKGGFAEFLQIGVDDSKFRLFNFSPDLTTATFWVFAIWSLTQFTQVLGQESMQRAWSTEGIKAAKRSVYTLAAVSLPGTVLFYATGTALYAYFCQHPGELNPLQPTDRVFPQYIVQTLPAGLSGLMIAAIIAAAISMAMNTSATAATRDYFRFFNPTASDATQQRFAWWGTLISGVIATAMAILLSTLESKSLWDLFSKLMSLVGGGFGGVIVLGLMTRRASTAGVWTGAIIASVVPPFLEFCTPIHWQTYGSLALVVCFAIGYAVSLIFPDAPRNLEGLTVWTPPKAAKVDG